MGQSTDAILVYGIPLEEDSVPFSEEDAKSGPSWMRYHGTNEDGVCLVRHCSGDYPMFILAIPDTETRAWRGHPKLVPVAELPFSPDWDPTLLSYAEKHRLEISGNAKPGWWLCSDWS